MPSRTVALFGVGTVGAEVAQLLQQRLAEQRNRVPPAMSLAPALKWAIVRDPAKARPRLPAGVSLTQDRNAAALDPDVGIGVETIGGVDDARGLVEELLRNGKDVVTANKALLAAHGPALFRLAHEHGRTIAFEAAVAGGMPIVAALSEGLAGNRIVGLAGILNGTSNFMLTAMHEQGFTYAEALAEAQRRGFAEADPTLDVDGTDAAQKLALLCRLAFGRWIDWSRIRRRGIAGLEPADFRYAKEMGCVVKLLAEAYVEAGKLHTRVGPTLVPERNPLAAARDEFNAVRVIAEPLGECLFVARGAGGPATASAVVADILGLGTGRSQRTFAALRLWEDDAAAPAFFPEGTLRSRFYLRFTIHDRPGVLAQIAGVLGARGISIAAVIQHEAPADAPGVPLLIRTHHAQEGAVWAALAETDALALAARPAVCLHVAD